MADVKMIRNWQDLARWAGTDSPHGVAARADQGIVVSVAPYETPDPPTRVLSYPFSIDAYQKALLELEAIERRGKRV